MRQSLFFTALMFIAGPAAWLMTNAPAQDGLSTLLTTTESQQPAADPIATVQAPKQSPFPPDLPPNVNTTPSVGTTPSLGTTPSVGTTGIPDNAQWTAPNTTPAQIFDGLRTEYSTRQLGNTLPTHPFPNSIANPNVAATMPNNGWFLSYPQAPTTPADAEAQRITTAYRNANTDEQRTALRDQLVTLTKQAFTERLAERRQQLSEMQSQIDEMTKRLHEREKLESEIIARRVAQLLDEPDPLDWNTAMDRSEMQQRTQQYGYLQAAGFPQATSSPNYSSRTPSSVYQFAPMPPSYPQNTPASTQPTLMPPTPRYNAPDATLPPQSTSSELRGELVERLEAQKRALEKELESLRAR